MEILGSLNNSIGPLESYKDYTWHIVYQINEKEKYCPYVAFNIFQQTVLYTDIHLYRPNVLTRKGLLQCIQSRPLFLNLTKCKVGHLVHAMSLGGSPVVFLPGNTVYDHSPGGTLMWFIWIEGTWIENEWPVTQSSSRTDLSPVLLQYFLRLCSHLRWRLC